MLNWNSVLDTLKDKKGKVVTTNPNDWNLETPGYEEVHNLWKANNISLHTMKWTNFYPGTDFDQSTVDEFATHVNLTTARAWISKVDPGYYVAWHWDVDDNEQEYLKLGKLQRYSCFICEPSVGQVILIDNDYKFNQPQGTIYKWPSYNAWHASVNASLKPKYMFHFLGY